MSARIVVLSGNPRAGSRTSAAALAVAQKVAGAVVGGSDGAEGAFAVVELADLAGEIFAVEHPAVDEALATVAAASVLVVASPVYKASYTGLLKSFFDLYQAGDLASVTAVGVLVAGQSGHLLAGEVHFRPLLTELGAATPTPVLTLLQGELPELDARLEPWIARYRAGLAASVAALAREPEAVLV